MRMRLNCIITVRLLFTPFKAAFTKNETPYAEHVSIMIFRQQLGKGFVERERHAAVFRLRGKHDTGSLCRDLLKNELFTSRLKLKQHPIRVENHPAAITVYGNLQVA